MARQVKVRDTVLARNFSEVASRDPESPTCARCRGIGKLPPLAGSGVRVCYHCAGSKRCIHDYRVCGHHCASRVVSLIMKELELRPEGDGDPYSAGMRAAYLRVLDAINKSGP